MMLKLGRLLTAMVTPFDSKGEVDLEQAKKLATALISTGSDGVVVSGTTGEAPTLSQDEKLRLITEVKSVVGVNGTVIAGTGSYNTKESIKLTHAAQGAGADAVLLVIPYYNKPSQDGLFEHFKAIAGSTDLPCILYNVPARTITNMTAQTTIRLSRIENIIGIKEASANMEQISEIIMNTDDSFLVYSGNDSDTFHIIALGGYGTISVASHLVGLQITDMITKTVSGQLSEAVAIHNHLLPLVKSLFILSNPVPLKHAMNYAGFNVGYPRLPLVQPDSHSANIIETTLNKYKLDFPSDK